MLSPARGRSQVSSQPRAERSSRALTLAGALTLAFLLVSLVLPRLAEAAPPGASADTRPVIVPGREQEIRALFQPHDFGDEPAPERSPGWTLHSFGIEVGTIVVWLAGPQERYARLTLDHLDHPPPEARTLTGFAAKVVDQPAGSEAAVEAVLAAIEANDAGAFWAKEVVYASEPREHPYQFDFVLSQLRLWLRDGLVFLVFITAVLLTLVVHKLRAAPSWVRWALPAVVVLGAALRLLLSPEVALAPWPYTRLLVSAGRVFYGPGLALLHPDPVWLSETITTSTLVYAMLAPLAIFAHARYLLDDPRAALLAALVVAVLPLHLRFSHSDAAFIPSITVSSTAFALVHAATREPGKLGGWLAVALLGLPIVLMYEVRPLNIMYYPLLLATAFVDQGVYSDKPRAVVRRAAAAFVILTAVTFGIGVPELLQRFGSQVDEGLSLRTLLSALEVIFSLRFNALLNPVFTPPGLSALALLGAVDLWRRGRRRLFAFVVGWLLAFLVAHAYILPSSPYMQARYHLHLVVPYLLLVACGAEAGLRWLARRRHHHLIRAGALVYILASPLIHLHGVRHVAMNDAQEWLFVHSLREQIPAECTVLEYTGVGTDMRFRRVGTWVEDGVEHQRFRVVEVLTPKPGEPEIPDQVRALLEEPPECLYWYEGLPCFGNKPIEEPKAPVCDAIEGFVALEEVAHTRFESEPYDENLGFGLGEAEFVELRLFRAHSKPPR